jgi:O-antigen/teichoic acid export membrane protein
VVKKATALLRQPLLANAGYLLGVNLIAGLAGFVFWGLAARLYDPGDVGVASAVVSAALLLAAMADLGLSISMVRFLPAAQSPRDFLNTAFSINAIIALGVAAVFLAGLSLWAPSLVVLLQSVGGIIGFLAFTVLQTVGTTAQAAFVARRRAVYALACALVFHLGRLLLLLTLAGLGAVGMVGSFAISTLAAVVLALAVFLPRTEVGYRPQPKMRWVTVAEVIPFTLGNYMAQLLSLAPQMIVPLLALELLGPSSSGSAYVAWMLGVLLVSPGGALANSAFAEGSNAPKALSGILSMSGALSLAVTLPIAALVGVGAPLILLVFGPDYAHEATSLLRWIAVAGPLVVMVRLYYTFLRVRRRVGRLVLASTLTAGMTLAIAAVYMRQLGIAAAGIGWLIGHVLVVIVALLDIRSTVWGRRRVGIESDR